MKQTLPLNWSGTSLARAILKEEGEIHMTYNVYQDDELIKEGIEEKEYEVTGLEPNTEYSFSVSEVIGDNESEKSESVTVTTKYSDVESVTVSPKKNNLDVGGTRTLDATVKPSTAKQDVSFDSSDDAVATVDSNGKVTAVAEGEATITVTAEGETDTATVNVSVPVVKVDSVELSPSETELEVEETEQLESTVNPSDADNKDVSYKSSDEEIASVDSEGLVTAVSDGNATITATTDDGGHESTSEITVIEPETDPEEGD